MLLLQLSITLVTVKCHGALVYGQVRLNPIQILGVFLNVFVTTITFYYTYESERQKF